MSALTLSGTIGRCGRVRADAGGGRIVRLAGGMLGVGIGTRLAEIIDAGSLAMAAQGVAGHFRDLVLLGQLSCGRPPSPIERISSSLR